MEYFLFPNWIVFSAFFLFLKIYNPTRLFLDNISITAISIFFSIIIEFKGGKSADEFLWVLSITVFALFSSIPYWLGSMVGSVLQQLLLLNEQSVQDKRFTEESEALAKISGLLLLTYALDNGYLFQPIIRIFSDDNFFLINSVDSSYFKKMYFLIAEYLKLTVLVAGKYIIIVLVIAICISMVDLFFKKASLSENISTDLKAVILIVLLNAWFFSDQAYLFKKMIEGLP